MVLYNDHISAQKEWHKLLEQKAPAELSEKNKN